MSATFRAADQPVTARREYWHHVVTEALGSLRLRVTGPLDERDRMVVGEVGAVRIGALWTGHAGGADRTSRHLRTSDPDVCKIDILVGGSGVVAQDGREAQLRRGDLTFVDLSRPACWRMSAAAHILAVVFPRSLLPLSQDQLAQITAVSVPGDRGAGALISPLAHGLVECLDDYDPADGARLGTALVDLVTVALAGRLDRSRQVPPDTRQRALLRRIHAFIELQLHDADLSPATIAAAHYISVRYLHRLFAAECSTVAGWIRQRRLERCRRDLLDPALRDRPVSAIGARWGFTSAAHFSRVFRTAYDLTPATFRQAGTEAAGQHR
jgi:AraC-like DNA-binding protein